MIPAYKTLASNYDKLWAELIPSPEHLSELTKICNNLIIHKSTYESVSQSVWNKSNYWWYVAITDQMEGGGGANTFLGNGQSLDHVTTEVPIGEGPFANFHDGAVVVLRDIPVPISVSQAAYNWESFNGWGYLNKPIEDPYLASYSNKYIKGKYVSDHVYDPNAISQQPGTLTILKVLIGIDKTIVFDDTPIVIPVPASLPIDVAAIQAKIAAMAPFVAMLVTLHDTISSDLKTISDQLKRS